VNRPSEERKWRRGRGRESDRVNSTNTHCSINHAFLRLHPLLCSRSTLHPFVDSLVPLSFLTFLICQSSQGWLLSLVCFILPSTPHCIIIIIYCSGIECDDINAHIPFSRHCPALLVLCPCPSLPTIVRVIFSFISVRVSFMRRPVPPPPPRPLPVVCGLVLPSSHPLTCSSVVGAMLECRSRVELEQLQLGMEGWRRERRTRHMEEQDAIDHTVATTREMKEQREQVEQMEEVTTSPALLALNGDWAEVVVLHALLSCLRVSTSLSSDLSGDAERAIDWVRSTVTKVELRCTLQHKQRSHHTHTHHHALTTLSHYTHIAHLTCVVVSCCSVVRSLLMTSTRSDQSSRLSREGQR
jgi:hypothetical protein